MCLKLHLAENTFALHSLFEHLQRLVDVVVANDDLQRLLRSGFLGLASYQGPLGKSTSGEPIGCAAIADYPPRARRQLNTGSFSIGAALSWIKSHIARQCRRERRMKTNNVAALRTSATNGRAPGTVTV